LQDWKSNPEHCACCQVLYHWDIPPVWSFHILLSTPSLNVCCSTIFLLFSYYLSTLLVFNCLSSFPKRSVWLIFKRVCPSSRDAMTYVKEIWTVLIVFWRFMLPPTLLFDMDQSFNFIFCFPCWKFKWNVFQPLVS
jgi:hypothetical protein